MRSKLSVTLSVAAVVVVADQLTKWLAVTYLEGQPPREFIGELLKLHFVRNPGAAFSLAGNYTLIITALAIGVSFVIIRTARTLASTWWAVVLGGVLGGALGNLIDRLFRSPAPMRGHVVDFLELPYWPIFNIADMSLVFSAVLAVILTLRGVELTEVGADTAGAAAQPAAAVGDGPGADAPGDSGSAGEAADPPARASAPPVPPDAERIDPGSGRADG